MNTDLKHLKTFSFPIALAIAGLVAFPLSGSGGLMADKSHNGPLPNESDWTLASKEGMHEDETDWTLARTEINEDEPDWTLAKKEEVQKEEVDWTLAKTKNEEDKTDWTLA